VEAAQILRTFAHYVDQGMVPNRFPDDGARPEYNTIDATLWFFEAIRAFHAATGDEDLVLDLFPVLSEIIDWHIAGTRYEIGVDPVDGLLSGGRPGVQLTWMDAKVGDWVVTPRIGKPVEVNALWYNALRVMADLARIVGEDPTRFVEAADKARVGFRRFWNDERGFCFDVIDGPEGDDPALRPNQLLAVSLPHSPLDSDRRRAVVEACEASLLTPLGLRTLGPDEPGYRGRYGGGPRERDGAYHQGTVWPWLIGPFVDAHFRVYADRAAVERMLEPLIAHLDDYGMGSIAECAEGDPPHDPRATIAQAWSVAELLRVLWRSMVGGDETATDGGVRSIHGDG
jgi:predicted glycogen debranching enzyme